MFAPAVTVIDLRELTSLFTVSAFCSVVLAKKITSYAGEN